MHSIYHGPALLANGSRRRYPGKPPRSYRKIDSTTPSLTRLIPGVAVTATTKKSKAWKENVGKIENWTYDEAEDRWACPAGQMLHFRRESKELLESGYEIRKRHYRSNSCDGCPLKERCTKAAGNREMVVSLERLRYQKQAREILEVRRATLWLYAE